jgi:HK97 family phage major capsid protein
MAELRPICNVATTGRDAVFMPALQKPSVAWGTTNLAVSAQDLAAGGERIEIFDLRALVLIHNNTLDDTDANIWAELNDQFSMAIAEAEDVAFATGAGNSSPQGVIADSRVTANYVASGVAAAISDANNNGVDALITILHGLKKAYRSNATWAMNSTTEGAVRQLKDTNGQYLWQPPVQAGAAATLLGRPVVNPEGLPDIAANAFPIVLGDFRKGYKIRDRQGIVVQRLVERYAEYDQTGFLVKRRTGGQVVLPEAFACLKVATS